MDPEANLSEQLSLAAEIIEIIDERGDEDGNLCDEDKDEVVDNANRLAELVQALDGWIRSGGFLPKRWVKKPKSQRELAEADDVGQFEFEHAGFRCFVRRFDKASNWCGYVLLPEGHPWRDAELVWASVHGGVTWNKESPGHLEGVDGWLVGFDCKHIGDFNPGLSDNHNGYGTWRDRKYVEAECRRLAEQAAEAPNSKEEE
jgi:hypothetical protein